jgi:hypothetical protein
MEIKAYLHIPLHESRKAAGEGSVESGFPQRPGTIPRFPRDLFWTGQFHEGAVMGGLYLGIAVTGVNALVATGLVIALM